MRLLWSLALILTLPAMECVQALPEKNYESELKKTILPFLDSGERFTFRSADGVTDLQGIRFVHPNAKGTIVVVNGSTESWLKYGEFFYDLYKKGFSIFSYDHRGQGLSPHLVKSNPQIDQIDDFSLYAADLNAFVRKVILPTHPDNLCLIAHSMGGGVATDYLQRYQSPFRAVILSAPMIRINTAPFPEPIASLVMKLLHMSGLGAGYAPGKRDHNPYESFEVNSVTSSRARWSANNEVWKNHPEAVLGGPSIDWVNQALDKTTRIRSHKGAITSPILILQAGKDAFVINPSRDELHKMFTNARIIDFPDSKHEILMERDGIRNKAMGEVECFFTN